MAVLQVDRRGSGANLQERGHAESADQLITDSAAARNELLRRSGCPDYHLVGVSWGGKLVVAVRVADGARLRSLSLVTPGLFPKIGVSKGEMARIGFAMLYQTRKLFDIPLNDADLFTDVPRWQHFFRTDEPTLRQCTAGFYLASRRMDKTVAQLSACPPLPIHLMLAGDECIVDNEKTAAFIRELGWPACRITTFENARHCLEFQTNPESYFEDLVSFIATHSPESTA